MTGWTAALLANHGTITCGGDLMLTDIVETATYTDVG